MHRHIERSFSPDDFVRLILRHKGKVFVWCVLVGGLSYAALVALPRKYQSDAKLFVRLGHETVSLDPTATTGTTVSIQESRENQLNSVRDMLKSRALLENVVKNLGADAILGQDENDEPSSSSIGAMVSRLKGAVSVLKVSSPVSDDETAVERLGQSIDVNLARNSSVIDISCRAGDSALARDTLQAFLEAYHNQHLAANRTAGSVKFFNEQAAHLKEKLDTTSEKLRDLKNESGLVSIAAEQDALQEQIVAADTALMDIETSLVAAEASITELRKALVELPAQLTTQKISGYPNSAADNMQQEFFKLLVTVHELRAKLGEDHPLLIVQMERVNELKKILDVQAEERVQTTIGVNPAHQALELDLKREETTAASLHAKRSVLKNQYASLQARLRSLNEHEIQIVELEREATLAETSYRSYADHLEQARIGEALDANRISSVNVVQPPSFVEKPISPKTTLVLGLGLLAAICGSVALPFGSEYLFGSSYRNVRSIDAQASASELAPTRRTLSPTPR